jgi:hypothetical protein
MGASGIGLYPPSAPPKRAKRDVRFAPELAAQTCAVAPPGAMRGTLAEYALGLAPCE